jgi:hypothetical protein
MKKTAKLRELTRVPPEIIRRSRLGMLGRFPTSDLYDDPEPEPKEPAVESRPKEKNTVRESP